MRPDIPVLTRAFVVLLLLGLAGGPRSAQGETTSCTAITMVPFTIPAPGIYCLTGDLTTNLPAGEAITIAANNVVLDLNGHKLGNLAAGPGTFATGIFAQDRKDLTIKNGTVQGFHVGISLRNASASFPSQGHVIEDLRADRNTFEAIVVQGRGNLIRNNQVVATGGSTIGTTAIGISVFGPENRVLNNSVIHVFATGPETSFGIAFSVATDALAVNNRITQAQVGMTFDEDSTGKFRDNLTSGVGTPFSHAPGVSDAGGNN